MKAIEMITTAQVLTPEIKNKIDRMLPSASPVDQLANIINLINNESKAIKLKESALAAQRKSLELLVEMAERTILDEMRDEGMTEIIGGLVAYKLKLNPHKLIIEDESLVPDLYKEEVVTVSIRKDKIKDEMKMGAEIPGCKLTQDQSVQLITNKG